jgi:2-keto-4-pentenoate hydratase/2-oxohepta-3-ene-1,7-dioic acid hydratase in catechol pathway
MGHSAKVMNVGHLYGQEMRISRFIDQNNSLHYGILLDNYRAEILTGDIYQGLEPTGEIKSVTKIMPPLQPSNILGIGLNYHEHAKETGKDKDISDNPILFMKPPSAVIGPGENIKIPKCSIWGPEVDFEAELAVVIGKVALDVPVESALDYILGYTCANDVSARRWQKHGGGDQWVRGKGFDTFCPLGPVLVTADEIPDPQQLQIKCILNGDLMQDGNSNDMIFPIAKLISEISRDRTLVPGTVILTGTPPGVGVARKPPIFMQDGDYVTIEIEKIGQLTNRVVGNY